MNKKLLIMFRIRNKRLPDVSHLSKMLRFKASSPRLLPLWHVLLPSSSQIGSISEEEAAPSPFLLRPSLPHQRTLCALITGNGLISVLIQPAEQIISGRRGQSARGSDGNQRWLLTLKRPSHGKETPGLWWESMVWSLWHGYWTEQLPPPSSLPVWWWWWWGHSLWHWWCHFYSRRSTSSWRTPHTGSVERDERANRREKHHFSTVSHS